MNALKTHPFRIFYSAADNPLENFYIPALSASVRYDRSAGYFSSSALAVAAAGVARLIQNGGHMRLLVGADLSEQDVEAIQHGHSLKERLSQRLLERFHDPQDALLRERLAVLAWMVAEGTLEIKVVLPRAENGLPLPAPQSEDYYHAKMGIFTDAAGDQIGFSGSVNESETAWKHNYETFHVYFSWEGTRPHLEQIKINFERLWNGQEKDWIALDIPQAVRGQLLKYRPPSAPVYDPLESISQPQIAEAPASLPGQASPQERILFQFLRDAPYLPNAVELGAQTSAIRPWPHQSQVANAIIQRFPERAMLCDEVGLGKTIEAGLVLRQLWLSGRVKRALILAPKSVLKQWQEELYEKFALDVPRYDAGRFFNAAGQELRPETANPWDAFDLLLAGSQLAKRADRRAQILSARPWDLLAVDEAHHARRKDFRQHIYRPNNLLSLLHDLNEQDKVASLLLMTATPMQVHPLEMWDLLSVLGMGGRWGADDESFLEFFSQLRAGFTQTDWELVFDMVRDHLASGASLDPHFAAEARAKLGPVKWDTLQELPARQGQRKALIQQLGPANRDLVKELARRHTPLSRYVFRNTRALLREYERRGIMKATVPVRKPQPVRVAMRADEETLYQRIDEYISHFYHKYENERRGMGFIMTVYRRRLTSSFYAVERSLQRRMDYLRGQVSGDNLFQDDDIEQDELDLDIEEETNPADRAHFKAELEYVTDFIQDLRLLSRSDSKLEKLKAELNRTFLERNTALVFTQYTDTLDYIREQLREVYGSAVACYSGRGGEVWNGIAWVETSKESVKNDFRQGKIRILVCTDSASEGLNLQTCGVLINYDMPWNPMRVEQRIGRIDRIGQDYTEVWISNYFYKDTIEDQIYARLSDRISWFETVVGDLQPILAEVGEMTRQLAMLPASERDARLEQELAALKERIQRREFASLNLDDFSLVEDPPLMPAAPVSLPWLQAALTESNALGHRFTPHPEIQNAYLLRWQEQSLPVTFSPECFDQHSDTLRLLTYGAPLLDEILQSVPAPEDWLGLKRCETHEGLDLCAWYGPAEIATIAELKDSIANPSPSPALPDAESIFAQRAQELREQQASVLAHRRKAQKMTELVKARQILLKAAMLELAMGLRPERFDNDSYPTTFNEQAVTGLQRHRAPWAALLKLAYEPGLAPSENDPYFISASHDSRETLKGKFAQLSQEARKSVMVLSRLG